MSDCSTHAFGVPLKPCPFCSAEPEVLSDGHRTWGLVQHNEGCLFPVYPKHEIPESDFAAWNSRAERTCTYAVKDNMNETEGMGDVWFECSACNYKFDYYADEWLMKMNYCPNCGARVRSE